MSSNVGIQPSVSLTSETASIGSRLRPYLELAKPGVTRMVVVTTALGAICAPVRTDWLTWFWAALGTIGVVAGANTFNMVIEAEHDALMLRTSQRPLPTGRVTESAAIIFAWCATVIGLLILGLGANLLATCVAGTALVAYVLLYTPLKRLTPNALYIGAVPGAAPPVIGWAAMTGHLGYGAWALFAVLFFWQLPHFVAISVFREEEYRRAGFKVSAVARSPRGVRLELILTAVSCAVGGMAPSLAGLGGWFYASTASLAGGAFLYMTNWALRQADFVGASRKLFLASLPYLLLLFVVLALDCSGLF